MFGVYGSFVYTIHRPFVSLLNDPAELKNCPISSLTPDEPTKWCAQEIDIVRKRNWTLAIVVGHKFAVITLLEKRAAACVISDKEQGMGDLVKDAAL